MTDLNSILIGIATKVGAPLVKSILERQVGPIGGDLVDAVVDAVAGYAGVPPDDLPAVAQDAPERVADAISSAEAIAPHLVSLYSKGLEHQTALMLSEQKEGPWQSGWRWGWMYFLGFLWLWRLVLLPVVNAAIGSKIEQIDLGIMLTLTSWFIALYMGGHTVKELGKNALDAIREWKAGRG